MQLDTFYCETVGGVFCAATNNSYPLLGDLKITDKGRSLEIMSVSGIDRKRKYIANSGSNERETRNEHSRHNPSNRVQLRQRSEEDSNFVDSDESYTTKKAKSRKPSKTGKNDKNSDTFEKQMLPEDGLSNGDQQIMNTTLESFDNLQHKNHLSEEDNSDKYESKIEEKLEEASNVASDRQTDAAGNEIKTENYQEFHEKEKSNSTDENSSNDFSKVQKEFNMQQLSENENENKSSSIRDIPLEDVKEICDDGNNVKKRSSTEEISNSFSVEKICNSTSLYDTRIDSTVQQQSPSFNDENRLLVNNNENIKSPPPIIPVDGCAGNSKFTKFPNAALETNIESDCDIVNERATEKENYQFLGQTFNYKQEEDLVKGNLTNESKNSECSETSWETLNRHQSYSDNTEACCFRPTESRSNLDGELPKETQENKTAQQLGSYPNRLEQAYSVHQQHARQKETPTEDVTDEDGMINSKNDGNQLMKIQSEQQIQQEDFSNLPLQHTNQHQQQQSQDEHYRQFQHPNQRSSYEQLFETDQRGQQIQSAQHNQEHSQQYTHEQFYQMRLQQQQHHLDSVMPHSMPQQLPNLQDSLQEEHIMAYLHHQAAMAGVGHQNRLQQDIYQDLMMDEFHEDANTAVYKLRHLSPTTTKHENQDDGYETSAGDVLTPNSHSSSTHSGTPQLPVTLHGATSSLAIQNVAPINTTRTDQQRHTQMQQTEGTNTQSSMGTIISENFNRDAAMNINHDPYKFTDSLNACSNDKVERLFPMQSEQQQPHPQSHNLTNHTIHQEGVRSIKSDMADITDAKGSSEMLAKPPPKRRGRKKKTPMIEGINPSLHSSNMINAAGSNEPTGADGSSGLLKVKERKKHDRFNGMSEEEVVKRTLPDHLCHNLDIVIIGINPGLFAAYKGHHYAGPGNHFWKCLYLSGLTQEQMSADEDYKLMKCGIGFTNMVQRATKGSADLTRKEIKEGSRILLEKLQRFQPKIAVFNGKLIFEVFSGKKDFNFGRQPDCVEGTNTYVWVMPSSSARCAQLPRAADKVPFYAALKKFRDYLNGLIPQIDEAECVFTEQRIRQMCEQEQLKNLAQSHNCSYRTVIDCTATSAEQEHQSSGDYSSFANNDNNLNPGTLNVAENTVGGPGPPAMVSHGNGYIVPPHFSGPSHPTPEKKKRGRPKKLRIQEIIDPSTGQKIQVTNAQHQHSNMNNDFNILNLSMISGEVPKKKRGRPKKVKTLSTEIVENPAIMLSSKQSRNSTVPPPQQQQTQQISLYNTPPNTMYGASASPNPNRSPSTVVGINNSSVYTPPNNVNSAQMTPPTNESSGDLGGGNNKHNLSESSPPPSSPNICAVDFETPSNSEHRSQGELHSQQLTTNLQQRPRFESSHIVGVDNGTSESFHQWMSPSHQFNYQAASLQQDNQQPYQTEHNLSIHHRSQKQVNENHQQQQSPQSPWAMSHRNQHFESNESNHQQQQHYMNTLHATSQHQQQMQQHEPQQLHHQTVQHSTDVTTKSLSGLESLVDQIPTIAESEAAAAAVESRLQTLQRGSTPGSFGDLQAESYDGNLMTENRGSSSLGNTTNPGEATNDTIATTSRNSSNGSNTPNFGISSATSCGSPINHYGLQRQGQTTSAASSPQAHTPYSGNVSGIPAFPLNSNTNQHSPSVANDLLTNSHTPPTIANSSTTTNTTTSHHLFSNFSVSHLAASSVTSCSSNNNNNNSSKTNDWQSGGARSPYHHSNLMAAAALQLHTAAASSSPTATPPHQMYIDPHTPIHHHPHHTHLSSAHQHHVQVNSLYSSAASQAPHTHHHPGMAVPYGAPPPTSQHPAHHVHNTSGDYGAYGANAAAAAAAHMLHMPNPNYSPYGYGTAPPSHVPATAQNTYSSWNHHGHPTVSSHHPHHLSMFERLKPSDIGSYSSF